MLRILAIAAILAAAFTAMPHLLDAMLPQGGEATRDERIATAARPEATPAGRKVRLPADASGHFSAEFRLNGRAVPAIIDTGATVVALNRDTARRIGLDVAESAFTGSAETANGRVRAAFVTVERVSLGRIEIRDVPAAVLDDRALGSTLVGMSFLSRLKRYSVEDGTLALEQ